MNKVNYCRALKLLTDEAPGRGGEGMLPALLYAVQGTTFEDLHKISRSLSKSSWRCVVSEQVEEYNESWLHGITSIPIAGNNKRHFSGTDAMLACFCGAATGMWGTRNVGKPKLPPRIDVLLLKTFTSIYPLCSCTPGTCYLVPRA